MTQTSELTQGEGNTKTSPNGYRNYFFTLNNPTNEDKNILIEYFTKNSKTQYLFQGEKGDKGTHHYQGIVLFYHQIKFTTLTKLNPKIHWEKLRSKKAGIEYCSKDATHIEGERWTNIKLKPKIIDPIANLQLRDWQKEILDILKEKPDSRKIYWYWEDTGNVGKTTLAKHICLNHKAIYLTGKSNDIKCGVSSYIEKNGFLDVAIFDYPRSLEQYISYEAIESIKNGIFFNGKYESGMVVYNTPHIIIFSNFHPQTHKLSLDRWIIKEIT